MFNSGAQMEAYQPGCEILDSHFHQTWLWLWMAPGDEEVWVAPPPLQSQYNRGQRAEYFEVDGQMLSMDHGHTNININGPKSIDCNGG